MKHLILTFALFSTTTIPSNAKILTRYSMNELTNDTLILKGKIIKNTFKNKANREYKNITELYLKTEKETYFIKFRDGKVLRKDLEKYVNKDVQLKVILREGTWDTSAGDPEAQSRIGKYLVVLEIIN
jgi:hypothetical protein